MPRDCKRCGECCRSVPVRQAGMAPETREWLLARGATEDHKREFLLIPQVCKNLVETPEEECPTRCSIHGTSEYPLACARYHGFGTFYKPPTCGYLPENP